MARRLGEVFGVDAEVWLAMQAQAEAWDALHGAIPAAQDEEHDEIREDVDGFITNTSTNTRKGLEEDGFETAST